MVSHTLDSSVIARIVALNKDFALSQPEYLIAGNWKMNLQLDEAKQLLQDIQLVEKDVSDVTLIINPPALYIPLFKEQLGNSAIALGAQNCSEHESGAYLSLIHI